ncbi:protealysin inhibitor emfourin [Microbacterium aurantiacum]|uniref:protealysin inhibitor emfourin n=1 Tax=Microbacterium aurantiacum TaxID=162393 RepID=UPI003D75116A
MNDPFPEPTDAERAEAGALEVEVTRSGGMAGIRRRWHAVAVADDRPRWDALLARCPWEDAPEETAGADRFVWRIRASCPGEAPPERTARLPESALVGPWLEVVRAVQSAAERP